mmetsp:Transcript_60695/g.121572  ORF Transcript_60695/g.121572 Transcript_60695/m.121572 type:complete len:96 (-) Transcript_60695:171-458(-)
MSAESGDAGEPEAPIEDAGISRAASKHSIISGKSGRCTRIDTYGNAIEKGKKMHRCAFPDDKDPGTPVEEKIEVTAYKGTYVGHYNSPPACCDLM